MLFSFPPVGIQFPSECRNVQSVRNWVRRNIRASGIGMRKILILHSILLTQREQRLTIYAYAREIVVAILNAVYAWLHSAFANYSFYHTHSTVIIYIRYSSVPQIYFLTDIVLFNWYKDKLSIVINGWTNCKLKIKPTWKEEN